MAEKDLFEELRIKAKSKSQPKRKSVEISAESDNRLNDIAEYMGIKSDVLLELMIGIHYLSLEILFTD